MSEHGCQGEMPAMSFRDCGVPSGCEQDSESGAECVLICGEEDASADAAANLTHQSPASRLGSKESAKM